MKKRHKLLFKQTHTNNKPPKKVAVQERSLDRITSHLSLTHINPWSSEVNQKTILRRIEQKPISINSQPLFLKSCSSCLYFFKKSRIIDTVDDIVWLTLVKIEETKNDSFYTSNLSNASHVNILLPCPNQE